MEKNVATDEEGCLEGGCGKWWLWPGAGGSLVSKTKLQWTIKGKILFRLLQ